MPDANNLQMPNSRNMTHQDQLYLQMRKKKNHRINWAQSKWRKLREISGYVISLYADSSGRPCVRFEGKYPPRNLEK
jgi:hypothetical protein